MGKKQLTGSIRCMVNCMLSIIILLLPIRVNAQTNNPKFIRGSAHYGFIIPHSKSIASISTSNPRGFQLELGKILLDPDSYANCNCFSKVGIALKYFNFDNPDLLGASYTAALFGEPYLGFRHRLFPTLKGEMGISYLTKVYHPVDNPDNLFFSTPISYYLGVNLALNFRLNSQSIVRAAFNYNHISNSGIREPNKGMNFPSYSLGYQHNFQVPEFSDFPKGDGFSVKKWRYTVQGVGTFTTLQRTEEYDEIKNFMFGMEGAAIRSLSNVNGLLTGFEVYYDFTTANANDERNADQNPAWLVGTFGHILVFGRFSFNQQLCYAFTPLPFNEGRFYQRYTVNYRLGDHFLFGASLRAHAHIADFMDLRVGWMF